MGSGGTDTIAGNVIEKGPNTPNGYFIHFGGEAVNVNSSLLVSGNTIINDRDHSILLLNQSQDAAGNNIPAIIENNTLYGMSASDLSTDAHAPPPDVSIGNSFLALPDLRSTHRIHRPSSGSTTSWWARATALPPSW